jgi:HK97 gp10 family phage protein
MADFRWTNKRPIGEVTRKVVDRICLEISASAKRITPVDTGNLRRSISTVPAVKEGGDRWTGKVGSNVQYAVFVEYGTRHQTAQPFLGPALEQARGKYGR